MCWLCAVDRNEDNKKINKQIPEWKRETQIAQDDQSKNIKKSENKKEKKTHTQ